MRLGSGLYERHVSGAPNRLCGRWWLRPRFQLRPCEPYLLGRVSHQLRVSRWSDVLRKHLHLSFGPAQLWTSMCSQHQRQQLWPIVMQCVSNRAQLVSRLHEPAMCHRMQPWFHEVRQRVHCLQRTAQWHSAVFRDDVRLHVQRRVSQVRDRVRDVPRDSRQRLAGLQRERVRVHLQRRLPFVRKPMPARQQRQFVRAQVHTLYSDSRYDRHVFVSRAQLLLLVQFGGQLVRFDLRAPVPGELQLQGHVLRLDRSAGLHLQPGVRRARLRHLRRGLSGQRQQPDVLADLRGFLTVGVHRARDLLGHHRNRGLHLSGGVDRAGVRDAKHGQIHQGGHRRCPLVRLAFERRGRMLGRQR